MFYHDPLLARVPEVIPAVDQECVRFCTVLLRNVRFRLVGTGVEKGAERCERGAESVKTVNNWQIMAGLMPIIPWVEVSRPRS